MDKELAKLIDHTYLQRSTKEDVKNLIREATEYGFPAVCIDAGWVPFAKTFASNINSKVKIATVPNFKMGGGLKQCVGVLDLVCEQADEIDYIINVFDLGDLTDLSKTVEELKIIRSKTKGKLKVIIEAYYVRVLQEKILKMTLEEAFEKLCKVVNDSGADFIKTDSGIFGRPDFGSLKKDCEIILKYSKLPLKAAGGIRHINQAKELAKLGVKRIGTSSGIDIVS